ncbi:hypothetical protein SAMN05192588_0518 [Nonlabens sp. Hel1_33_55]|nr:hypothetical protein SAMN05192588_0518 [Nonlabens sp. Hel1_33_55]
MWALTNQATPLLFPIPILNYLKLNEYKSTASGNFRG